jgi:predicted RNase H-like nuclease
LADTDGPVAVVAIDMPIGLPDRGRRQADVLARKAVGALRWIHYRTRLRAYP